MVVVLDTVNVPARERNDALSAVISDAAYPTRVSHDLPDELIRNRTQSWAVGASNSLIRTQDTNMRFTRASRNLRADDREVWAMSLQHRGTGIHVSAQGDAVIQPAGALLLADVARSYVFAFDGKADNASFLMTYDELDLPFSLVAKASWKLGHSPLHRLVQSHFAHLSDVAEELPGDSAASALVASTTIQLIRALVASTGLDDRRARDASQETRRTTLLTYARQHLRDPELNARQIAAANHMSERQVYKLWSQSSESLSEWILRERLDGARKDLAAPSARDVTIEVISRRWGFVDASHFSRRFRQAYGATPREWRAARRPASEA